MALAGTQVLKLAQGYTAAHPDGMVRYTAHELRHVCASLLIASGASDMQVAHQMGHSKVETTKNIYGHLFAWDRSAVLDAMNQIVSRLHAYELTEGESAAGYVPDPTDRRARNTAAVGTHPSYLGGPGRT
jgi:Phage integrase family